MSLPGKTFALVASSESSYGERISPDSGHCTTSPNVTETLSETAYCQNTEKNQKWANKSEHELFKKLIYLDSPPSFGDEFLKWNQADPLMTLLPNPNTIQPNGALLQEASSCFTANGFICSGELSDYENENNADPIVSPRPKVKRKRSFELSLENGPLHDDEHILEVNNTDGDSASIIHSDVCANQSPVICKDSTKLIDLHLGKSALQEAEQIVSQSNRSPPTKSIDNNIINHGIIANYPHLYKRDDGNEVNSNPISEFEQQLSENETDDDDFDNGLLIDGDSNDHDVIELVINDMQGVSKKRRKASASRVQRRARDFSALEKDKPDVSNTPPSASSPNRVDSPDLVSMPAYAAKEKRRRPPQDINLADISTPAVLKDTGVVRRRAKPAQSGAVGFMEKPPAGDASFHPPTTASSKGKTLIYDITLTNRKELPEAIDDIQGIGRSVKCSKPTSSESEKSTPTSTSSLSVAPGKLTPNPDQSTLLSTPSNAETTESSVNELMKEKQKPEISRLRKFSEEIATYNQRLAGETKTSRRPAMGHHDEMNIPEPVVPHSTDEAPPPPVEVLPQLLKDDVLKDISDKMIELVKKKLYGGFIGHSYAMPIGGKVRVTEEQRKFVSSQDLETLLSYDDDDSPGRTKVKVCLDLEYEDSERRIEFVLNMPGGDIPIDIDTLESALDEALEQNDLGGNLSSDDANMRDLQGNADHIMFYPHLRGSSSDLTWKLEQDSSSKDEIETLDTSFAVDQESLSNINAKKWRQLSPSTRRILVITSRRRHYKDKSKSMGSLEKHSKEKETQEQLFLENKTASMTNLDSCLETQQFVDRGTFYGASKQSIVETDIDTGISRNLLSNGELLSPRLDVTPNESDDLLGLTYEQRFEKSLDKLELPEWFREKSPKRKPQEKETDIPKKLKPRWRRRYGKVNMPRTRALLSSLEELNPKPRIQTQIRSKSMELPSDKYRTDEPKLKPVKTRSFWDMVKHGEALKAAEKTTKPIKMLYQMVRERMHPGKDRDARIDDEKTKSDAVPKRQGHKGVKYQFEKSLSPQQKDIRKPGKPLYACENSVTNKKPDEAMKRSYPLLESRDSVLQVVEHEDDGDVLSDTLTTFDEIIDNLMEDKMSSATNSRVPSPTDLPAAGSVSSLKLLQSAEDRKRKDDPNTMVWLTCQNPKCRKTVQLKDARQMFKSCHNCYARYCCKECRKIDWDAHKGRCLFSRLNSKCKQVMRKIHDDDDVLEQISRFVRTGFLSKGRGCVSLLFVSQKVADDFLIHGVAGLLDTPKYFSVKELSIAEEDDEHREKLLQLCRSYNPDKKLILNVGITLINDGHFGSPYFTSEYDLREKRMMKKCTKISLKKSPSGIPTHLSHSPRSSTLILTPLPGDEGQYSEKQRQNYLNRIQTRLRQRGVSLRHQYPDIYEKLIQYVRNGQPFAPTAVYPVDQTTGKTFTCMIMPESEPDSEWIQEKRTDDSMHLLNRSTAV